MKSVNVQKAIEACYSKKTMTQEAYESHMQKFLGKKSYITVISYGEVEKIDQYGNRWEDWMDGKSNVGNLFLQPWQKPNLPVNFIATPTSMQIPAYQPPELKALPPDQELGNKDWEESEYYHNSDLENAVLFSRMSEDEMKALAEKSPSIYQQLYDNYQEQLSAAEDQINAKGGGYTHVEDDVVVNSIIDSATTIPGIFSWLNLIPGVSLPKIPLITEGVSIGRGVKNLIDPDKAKQEELLKGKYQKQDIAGDILGGILQIYGVNAAISNAKGFSSAKGTSETISELTESELEAINKYTGNDYKNINDSLRGLDNMTEANKVTNTNLHSALEKASLPEDMTLYRGTSTEALGNLKGLSLKELVGESFVEKGYMSTSTNSSVAFGTFSGNMQMTIKVPQGAKGLDISSISKFGNESEILFQTERELRITAAKMRGNTLHIVVKMGK